MWYEDLSQCDYFANYFYTIAVGFLENGKSYTKGETANEVVEKIYEFNKTSGMYYRFLGYHQCDFCGFVNIELGATTILLAYKDKIYAFPMLITHYIESHSYLPPAEFIEAVLNYNHEYAMDYLRKIVENKSSRKK
ncbi:MAG: hypothetical protein AAB336_09765 [Acidobacteriota bacterium]